MKRRQFITLLGGAAGAWPLGARGQEPMPVIGFLHSASPDGQALYVAAFREGLRQTSNVESRVVTLEFSWGNNRNDRLREASRHRTAQLKRLADIGYVGFAEQQFGCATWTSFEGTPEPR
jgi:hypothetical protein